MSNKQRFLDAYQELEDFLASLVLPIQRFRAKRDDLLSIIKASRQSWGDNTKGMARQNLSLSHNMDYKDLDFLTATEMQEFQDRVTHVVMMAARYVT